MDVNRYFPEFTKENTDMNESFSVDSSLFSGENAKENTCFFDKKIVLYINKFII